MSTLTVLNHPLIDHKMAIIRDKNTGSKEFRESVSEIGMLITYEISRNFKTIPINLETPMQKTTGYILAKPVVIVPILRAGLGMVDGIHKIIPTAKIGHVGFYRDEETLLPVEYFSKFPKNITKSTVLVVDPMLATGGSASATISLLKKRNVKDIRFIAIVGCPEGVKKLQEDHPDVAIYLAAMDARLDEKGYIVPGLGDCGDRLFGTK
ncbi:MAG: uracil phosphoribosyltransferase [Acholeplasmataceae bacterium]|jgi:uracil phosphoribosyltransferase|nr:uracil phosphoribosyltransferase [Acholeplasmataceae bacterium]